MSLTQKVWNEGNMFVFLGKGGICQMPLLFFSYPWDTQTMEVRRKVDGYRLLLKTEGAWERQKGSTALWWQCQGTQTEPSDFNLIFRGLVHLVWALFLLSYHIYFYRLIFFLDFDKFSKYSKWNPRWDMANLSKFYSVYVKSCLFSTFLPYHSLIEWFWFI